MIKYTVVLTKRAQKQLDKLADNIAEPIFEAIDSLADNPRPLGYKKLKNRDGYRIRAGDYASSMKYLILNLSWTLQN